MSQTDLPTISYHEYPNGHLNHLSPKQMRALEEFKTISEKDGCHNPASEHDRASHDDETLLRFLRARKFKWRAEQDIDKWYDTVDVDRYEATRRVSARYTHWTGRRDRRGIPPYVFNISGLDAKTMSGYESTLSTHPSPSSPLPSGLRHLFATYEHLTTFVMPLCSAVPSRAFPDVPVSQTCNIVDVSGMGPRQFWALRSHLQVAGALATAHYPETLGRTFVVGAPGFFPTVRGWLKGWFDAGTVEKIVILGRHGVREALERYVDVGDIPRRYGGELEWEFGMMPVLDEGIREVHLFVLVANACYR